MELALHILSASTELFVYSSLFHKSTSKGVLGSILSQLNFVLFISLQVLAINTAKKITTLIQRFGGLS
ncbi:uncharacterized protein METZ01_LOCUS70417 [marine metagenome]|uniref:Uncharacterized protein n=1 Tax=marine metagenome TaxID=408172 RepID=A0A381TU25_9ZZZZ